MPNHFKLLTLPVRDAEFYIYIAFVGVLVSVKWIVICSNIKLN